MGLFSRLKNAGKAASVQTGRGRINAFDCIDGVTSLMPRECGLYDAMREAVPIIDAAIDKILRLVGPFSIVCEDDNAHILLERFISEVKVGANSAGLSTFLNTYLNNLLTYGNAAGEIVLNSGGTDIAALYNAPLANLEIKRGDNALDMCYMVKTDGYNSVPVKYPELILFSALNPAAGEIMGRSLLSSLPFVSSVLLKIYSSIGHNFERTGNLRYAVTYKPGAASLDRAYSKDIAQSIAKEWADAMNSAKSGTIKDFVAVGDVDIKVIGADNQFIDANVPVRQMLEQIVAKLGLPPFLLGLAWSTTERMSKQQADILTSELESYRRILDPVILKICGLYLAFRGIHTDIAVRWDVINMQDELDIARTRLLNAQANQLETGQPKAAQTGIYSLRRKDSCE